MDRLITLRRITSTTQGDYGEPIDTTADTQVWAQVLYPGSASEGKKAFQIYPERSVTFVIRHPNPTDDGSGITIAQDDTIVFESRDYQILGFEEIGRRDGLRIFCKEQGTDGR